VRLAQLMDRQGRSRLAVLRDARALVLAELDPALPMTLQMLIDADADALATVRAASAAAAGEAWHPLSDFGRAILITPPKIMAIGVNYVEHATEQAVVPPQIPIVFALWSNSGLCSDATLATSPSRTRSTTCSATPW
jgi:2-keto-4-pentenoate hydratase/2-oxohepta-3-ene-1,7-dioic acid hydratase in catechol pathway